MIFVLKKFTKYFQIYIYYVGIVSDDHLKVQQRFVETMLTIVNGVPQQCMCHEVDGRKCTSRACTNYDASVLCPATCGQNCKNNP